VEWNYGDGTSEAVPAVEFQRTEAAHTFKAAGTFTIVEKIKTDDLASPEVTVERKLSVSQAVAPVQSTQTPQASPSQTQTSAPSSGVQGFVSYRVGLASSSLTVTPSGTVVVKVVCSGTSSCSGGAVTLRTLAAVAASAGKHRSILTLASARFSLLAGQSKTLTLRLSSRARDLIRRTQVLRARATLVARDSSGATHTTPVLVTLRQKRHR
jgi:hypothetical protein